VSQAQINLSEHDTAKPLCPEMWEQKVSVVPAIYVVTSKKS